MEKRNIYLVSSNENWSDPYFSKKIKEIHNDYGLDAVFANSFEKFPVLQRYCSRYNIETIKIDSIEPEEDFNSVVKYAQKNPDKKTLVNLTESAKIERLKELFKNVESRFDTFIVNL